AVNQRYSYFLMMAEYAPNAIIITCKKDLEAITSNHRLLHRAYGVGDIDRIRYIDYDISTITKELDIKPINIVKEGKCLQMEIEKVWSNTFEYMVVIKKDKKPAKELVYAVHNETDLFIDIRLLSAEQKERLVK